MNIRNEKPQIDLTEYTLKLEKKLKEQKEVTYGLIDENILLKKENEALKSMMKNINIISSIYNLDILKEREEEN